MNPVNRLQKVRPREWVPMSMTTDETNRMFQIQRAALAACLILMAWPAWAADVEGATGAVTGKVVSSNNGRNVGIPGVSLRLDSLANRGYLRTVQCHRSAAADFEAIVFGGIVRCS